MLVQHTIDSTPGRRAGTPTPPRRAEPAGVIGAEIWVKVDGPPPVDPGELTFLAVDTRARYTRDYDGPQGSKAAHLPCQGPVRRRRNDPATPRRRRSGSNVHPCRAQKVPDAQRRVVCRRHLLPGSPVFAPGGAPGCSHGWSAVRRQADGAQPVESGFVSQSCPGGAEEATDPAVDQSNTYFSSNSIPWARRMRRSSVLKSSFL
jgi:hypothetical protein